MPNARGPRERQKTFDGCFKCRTRKVKCDGSRPSCKRCVKIGFTCPGYKISFRWVPINELNSTRQGLGGLPPDSTWKGYSLYKDEDLDQLLLHVERSNEARGPFGILLSRQPPLDVQPYEQLILHSPQPQFHESLDVGSRTLFHHYTTVVALKMMPMKGERNPWKTHYPSLALNASVPMHSVLLHAILSQSAAHVCNLGVEVSQMKIYAIEHYSKALRLLRDCVETIDSYPFESVIASILSLIMAEVYQGGSSSGWRSHLVNSWKLALRRIEDRPWLMSEMAWLTAQSLCMVKTRSFLEMEEDKTPEHMSRDKAFNEASHQLFDSVSKRYDFGFTAGARPDTIRCLEDAFSSIREVQRHGLTPTISRSITELTHRLQTMSNAALTISHTSTAYLHDYIFNLGTIICLHKHTLSALPSQLLQYVAPLLLAVQKLLTTTSPSDGQDPPTLTLWPIFVAAVESYRSQERDIVTTWLEGLERSGIGNRKDVGRIIQGVWRQRREKFHREKFGRNDGNGDDDLDQEYRIGWEEEEDALGTVAVDWRDVQMKLGLDILLV